MKYLVTGATGFIGSRVVGLLQAAGHEVVVFTRRPAAAGALNAPGTTTVTGDVTDAAAVSAAMTGCDGVFHLAGWRSGSGQGRERAAAINVDGTKNVLIAMRKLEVKKGVFTSSLAVNSDTRGVQVDEDFVFLGKHLRLYDETKWLAHHGVASPLSLAGLPLVTVMPGMVVGVDNPGIFARFLKGKLNLIPRRTALCWSHIDDCAQAHILAMERGVPGRTYIIGGPVATVVEAVDIAAKLTGLPLPKRIVAPWLLKTAALFTRPFGAALPQMLQAEYLRSAAGTTYIGDDSRARAELGWQPRDLEATLRDTLAPLARDLGISLPSGLERGPAATTAEKAPERP